MSPRGFLVSAGAFTGLCLTLACSNGSNPRTNPIGRGGNSGTATGGAAGEAATGGASGGSSAAAGMGGTTIIVPPGGSGGSGPDVESGGSGGSAGRNVTKECAATKATATDMTMVVPADIIFAIDSSGSMDEEIEFVQTFMNGFSQQISAAGVDARVILIGDPGAVCIGAPLGSGQCPDDSNPPNYIHIDQMVDSNDALNLFIDTYPQWQQHLRPNASKSLVVVTDDDATDGPNNSSAMFRANFVALDPAMFAKWTFNGVYCFTECDDAAAIGEVYVDLVAETMGVGGDLCLQDFQPVFDRLAQQIITTLGTEIECEWPFPIPPTGQTFSGDLVTVDRSAGGMRTPLTRVSSAADCAQGGWYYDSELNPTRILACPSTCMELQGQTSGQVDVTFGCEMVGSCVATGASTINDAGACNWPMPEPPSGQAINLASVNVRYTSPSGFATNIGKVGSAAECAGVTHGWHYDDATNPQRIVTCPQTCTELQAGGASAKLDVLFGCMSRPAVPR